MPTANGHASTFWAAADLAKVGYSVFPVKGKAPSVEGGFYAATTDVSQVAKWITEGRENHDVAFATGIVSGVVVVEADMPGAYKRMEEKYGPPHVLTRRGGHWYFRHPKNGKVSSKSLGDGLDRKGDGGYVIAPPSTDKRWTEDIPDRNTLPLLPREFRDEKAASTGEAEPRTMATALKEAAAEAIARRVAEIPPGKRHEHMTHLCGVLLSRGVSGSDAEDVLIAAWSEDGGELAERAPREVPNTLRTTAQAIADGRATGVPKMEEITPGLYEELEEIFGWQVRVTFGGREVQPVSNGTPSDKRAEDEDDKEERPTQAQLLVRCAEGADLFHTPDGEAFAMVSVGGHRETHPVKSKGFRRWLVRGFYELLDRPPGAQALQDALGLLEARAHFDGPEREVYVRIAEHEGAIYVDLANERWEAVEITSGGWRVVPEPPVRFRRPRGMLALPTPAKPRDGRDDGDDPLRRFLNLEDQEAYRLVVAWLVQALRPTGPYPVLILLGEQGSAKSTAERLLRSLVDPSTAPLRTTPRNEHDLFIAATSAHVVAFDNLSNLQPWLSDALCRLSTGGGFSTRTLYENREQELFDATRPVILNGITDVATRPDLLDRALMVTLPPIPEERRRPEAELWREFEKACPAILAFLFDAVAGALGAVPSLRLEGMPRMADFALWATAAEGALDWDQGAFMEAYAGNRSEATEGALEVDPVADAVRSFMAKRDEWTGTAAELWTALNEIVDEGIRRTKAWPGAPNALSSRLKRLAPALRGIGIDYEDARLPGGGRKRAKSLKKKKYVRDRLDRPFGQESPAKQENRSGTMIAEAGRSRDDVAAKTVPEESPANGQIRDDGNDRDDDLQPSSVPASFDAKPGEDVSVAELKARRAGRLSSQDVRQLFSRPPGWLRNQANHCRRQGAPRPQLEALAAAVASKLCGDPTRGGEILAAVEAQFHPVGCECEECA